ncbi:MAG: argininosuccinate lyase, partial [Xanthomonadales bacterium]|nr:argininosuccinate lyase [Xanthomonadales bacterium]
LSLPSGYHRDLQASKGAIVHGFGRGLAAMALLPDLMANLQWREDALRAAIDSGMYATDVAVQAAVAGVPFREAYKAAAAGASSAGVGRTPADSLAARTSPGAAADLRLDELRRRWEQLSP